MTALLQALDSAYGDLAILVDGLDEDRSWRPTRCPGWHVRDLVWHLLSDAQRALVALADPGDELPDRDAVSYWTDAPGAPEPDSRGIRAVRAMASPWGLRPLTATFVETTSAVRALARRTPAEASVRTQGHVLLVADLLATVVVEATVHHLDLVVDLEQPGPGPDAFTVTRKTLDGLLGRETPAGWDSAGWVLAATGRIPAAAEHRDVLGPDLVRLPLLG